MKLPVSKKILVRTPNLDMLRREGMTVEGGYSQTRCTPSRVSFMTGKYAWKVGLPGEIVLDYDSGNALPLRKISKIVQSRPKL